VDEGGSQAVSSTRTEGNAPLPAETPDMLLVVVV
jgi:hypothetical protein